MADRNQDGTFAKGHPGGPGRKHGTKLVTPLLRVQMEATDPATGKTNLQLMVEKVCEIALTGERWAVEYVTERLDGKVPQQIQSDHGDERDVVDAVRFVKGGPDDCRD